jgi:hypothetical protein
VTDVTEGCAEVIAITVKWAARAHGVGIETTGPALAGRRWEPNMTKSLTSELRQAGLILTIATTVLVLSAHQSFAFSAEAQQMCTGDAFKLCSSEIPSIPKVTACMISHRAQLSSGCRAVMDKELSGKGKKVAANDE